MMDDIDNECDVGGNRKWMQPQILCCCIDGNNAKPRSSLNTRPSNTQNLWFFAGRPGVERLGRPPECSRALEARLPNHNLENPAPHHSTRCLWNLISTSHQHHHQKKTISIPQLTGMLTGVTRVRPVHQITMPVRLMLTDGRR